MRRKTIQYNGCIALLCLCTSFISVHVLADREPTSEIKPLIVTSIKPLAIIAKSAVADAADVEYLLPSNQAPHDFSPPASALRKMAKADLVLWIGPEFETASRKAIQRLPSAKRITAMDIEKAQGDFGDADKQRPEHKHKKAVDPHVWLSPDKANNLAAEVQARLGLPISPIISRQQIAELAQELAVAKGKTYLSHHDAYGHFAQAFGLALGLSIRDASGEMQGVKSQYQLRKNIASANISCVFVEPQYQDKDAAVIADEFGLPLIELDLQGMAEPLKGYGYPEFIGNLVAQFKACYQ